MKIVIFDKENNLIRDTIFDAENVEYDGKNIKWNTGQLKGITDTTNVLVLDDAEEVPQVSYEIHDNTLDQEKEVRQQGKVNPKARIPRSIELPQGLKEKDKKEQFRKKDVFDLQREMEELKAEIERMKGGQ